MKSQKGITLISLTIYVISMSIIIGIIAIISTFFYKNIIYTDTTYPITQYTKFSSVFSEEVNHDNIKVLDCGKNNGQNYIAFNNGVQYTYVSNNKAIYRNKVKISGGIKDCVFYYKIQNGKNIVIVEMQDINGKDRTQTYTLKN